MVLRLAWIFPEVFISIRLVKAKIDGLRLAEEAQISCARGGWRVGLKLKIRISSAKAEPIN